MTRCASAQSLATLEKVGKRKKIKHLKNTFEILEASYQKEIDVAILRATAKIDEQIKELKRECGKGSFSTAFFKDKLKELEAQRADIMKRAREEVADPYLESIMAKIQKKIAKLKESRS